MGYFLYVPHSVLWLLAVFLVLSWPIVIVASGLWQARGRGTYAGVTWPCLNRDPEVGWCSITIQPVGLVIEDYCTHRVDLVSHEIAELLHGQDEN